MKRMIRHLARKPILASIGLLMTTIVLLAVVSMVTSVHIAKTNEGMATAINQSGSLRMQSYRIGVALADESIPAPERAARARTLATEFQERLESPRLVNAIQGKPDDQVSEAYARVTSVWRRAVKPSLKAYISLLAGDTSAQSHAIPRAGYLAAVDGFVDQIDALVQLLEEVAEHRIDRLRMIQGVSLALTVCIVIVTMVLVIRRVIRPLGELLACADRARQGDFSWRTRFTDNDELGRLGAAMNLMAADLSHLYREARGARGAEDPGSGAEQPLPRASLPHEQDIKRGPCLCAPAAPGPARPARRPQDRGEHAVPSR